VNDLVFVHTGEIQRNTSTRRLFIVSPTLSYFELSNEVQRFSERGTRNDIFVEINTNKNHARAYAGSRSVSSHRNVYTAAASLVFE